MATVRHLGLLPTCITELKSTEELPSCDDAGQPFIPVTLDTMLKWYWRVKSWKIESSITYTSGTHSYSFIAPAGSSTADHRPDDYFNGTLMSENVQNEKDLVCFRPLIVSLQGGSSVFDDGSFVYGEGTYTALYLYLFNGVYKIGNTFYVGLDFTHDYWMDVWNIYYIIIQATADYCEQFQPSSVGKVIYGSAEIDGHQFNLAGYAGNNLIEDLKSASVSITPNEYWPYDPGDGGGPIYDSTTGAQLREFP